MNAKQEIREKLAEMGARRTAVVEDTHGYGRMSLEFWQHSQRFVVLQTWEKWPGDVEVYAPITSSRRTDETIQAMEEYLNRE